jgi:hypothetical protein
MSTGPKSIKSTRRPLAVYYIGRPASLYIDAMACGRRNQANPPSSSRWAIDQPGVL